MKIPREDDRFNESLLLNRQIYPPCSHLLAVPMPHSSVTFPNEAVDMNRQLIFNSGVAPPQGEYFYLNAPDEVFARKVFVGGLPFDISRAEVVKVFSRFGNVQVDWPRRSAFQHKENIPGSARYIRGYVFLVFDEERSVQQLVRDCHKEGQDCYLLLSSPTMKNKPVQIRAWRLADTNFMPYGDMILNSRRTVFIGGVPRPTTASDLAHMLEQLHGPVCYVGIDIDPEFNYPKGAARVTFATTYAFFSALNGRFMSITCGDITKRVEIKPYMMDDETCDECKGTRSSAIYAPYFCGDFACLQYYCESCWDRIHFSNTAFADHMPLVRFGDDTKLLSHLPHHTNRSAFIGEKLNESAITVSPLH